MPFHDSYQRTPVSVYGKHNLWHFTLGEWRLTGEGINRAMRNALRKAPLRGGWQTPAMWILWRRRGL